MTVHVLVRRDPHEGPVVGGCLVVGVYSSYEETRAAVDGEKEKNKEGYIYVIHSRELDLRQPAKVYIVNEGADQEHEADLRVVSIHRSADGADRAMMKASDDSSERGERRPYWISEFNLEP